MAEQESMAALNAAKEIQAPNSGEKPAGYKENREMGLGRAPGIDLHAIYNSHKPRREK
jgi:hypothetical protein